jgi:hypothetical protein
MIRKFIGLIIGLGLVAAMFGGAAAISNYGQCVAAGGTVTGSGANQVCTVTQVESGTLGDEGEWQRDYTVTTTTTVSPGGEPIVTTDVTYGDCRNPAGATVPGNPPTCPTL